MRRTESTPPGMLRAMDQRPIQRGEQTTEFEKTTRAERWGRGFLLGMVGLCAVGVGLAVAVMLRGAPLGGALLCMAIATMAVGAGGVGAYLMGYTTGAYSAARATVKAAAAAPPSSPVSV